MFDVFGVGYRADDVKEDGGEEEDDSVDPDDF